MKIFLIYLVLFFGAIFPGIAQRLVFDQNHFNIINENGAVRLGAENTHNSYLNTINNRLSDIKVNMSAVILVQQMIRNSLVQVNQGLKNGVAVVQIGQISAEILTQCAKMIQYSKSSPYLLLFAEEVARDAKFRGLSLVTEVSGFVLKEGFGVLMDYQKRDLLLRHITLELRVIRELCYAMSQSIYWAQINGLLKSLNPFQNFINQDRRMAEDVLLSAGSL